MGMKSLQSALEKVNHDTFEVGTVIRWKASGQYDYAAIKAGDGKWYTTAQHYNTFVKGSYTFDDLLVLLTRTENTDVLVSTAWASVSPK